MEPVFLCLDEVLVIHDEQIKLHGGSFGLGEYLHPTIPEMAAAYLFHLAQNHPFIDGNKRVGAKAALVFPEINDWESTFNEDELEKTVLGVASGVILKPELIALFENHSRQVP